MELINLHTKRIMEKCKEHARSAGLQFGNETLEYIVTNKDLLELSPKIMIPTLYDYWVNDVEVLKEQGKYKLYPTNPYETVINSRPAISFYNDNNPDWMNIMIFYHVIGHIDFFQNNYLFNHTWNDDFVGQALADKRLITNLRSEYGRWVDYIIEFSRSIDNIVGYFALINQKQTNTHLNKLEYYFDIFLQETLNLKGYEIYKEVEHYNQISHQNKEIADAIFFAEVISKHPEFQALYDKYLLAPIEKTSDITEYILKNSPFLNKETNKWMKSVVNIVRNTSLYFQPQIRSKIMNEGWASYWHDKLFREDPRIQGHEIAYAKLNAGVTSISRIGLNPYAIGLRLFEHIEEMSDKGKISYDFQKIENVQLRDTYNKTTGKGKETIFNIRSNFSDFMMINTFIDQDFINKHDLFVTGKRINQQKGMIEYYIKSRKAEDYKKMLIDSMYHPPKITVKESKTNESCLYLAHSFENKQLYMPFIEDTLIGIEYLWGNTVKLETTEIYKRKESEGKPVYEYRKILFTMKDKKLKKEYTA